MECDAVGGRGPMDTYNGTRAAAANTRARSHCTLQLQYSQTIGSTSEDALILDCASPFPLLSFTSMSHPGM